MMARKLKQPTNRVGIYARVLSDQQAQQGTIDSQIMALCTGPAPTAKRPPPRSTRRSQCCRKGAYG